MGEVEEEAPGPLGRLGCACSFGMPSWTFLGLLDYFPHNPPAGKYPIRSPDVTTAVPGALLLGSDPRLRLSPRDPILVGIPCPKIAIDSQG